MMVSILSLQPSAALHPKSDAQAFTKHFCYVLDDLRGFFRVPSVMSACLPLIFRCGGMLQTAIRVQGVQNGERGAYNSLQASYKVLGPTWSSVHILRHVQLIVGLCWLHIELNSGVRGEMTL